LTVERKTPDLVVHVVRGSFWGIAFRWTVRLLGLVNTIILARLLTPADFGVVAIAMLLVGSVEIFLQNGQLLALIRHPSPTREHYDSAWTVSVLLGLALGLIVWMTAPLATLYFHEIRAREVIHVVALRTMISGAENIAIVNLRRDLRFRANFVYNSAPSLVSFIVTVVSAFVLRNYWALVIGIMSQQITSVAVSYIMEPYLPRFSLVKAREIWSFSSWALVRSIGVYLNNQVDKFVIGGFSGAATMGRYEVATDIATSPTAEINAPMITALFPVMARVQDDQAKRRELYLRVLYWSALICTSTAIGVALVTDDLVDLVLGPKWGDVKPLMPWLALAFGILGLSSSVYSAFETIGRANLSARLQWTRFLVLAICTAPVGFLLHSVLAVAITRLLVTIVITPALFMALARTLGFHTSDFARTFWRPMLAGLFMAGVVLALNAALPFRGPPRLALDVIVGALTYIVVVLATWQLIGKPEGPETIVWSAAQRTIRGLAPS
jgi:lipopolysaccharide exporter